MAGMNDTAQQRVVRAVPTDSKALGQISYAVFRHAGQRRRRHRLAVPPDG